MELMPLNEFSLPLKTEVIFTNHKGEAKASIEKRQKKLLSHLEFLKPFLEQDEKIQLITVAASPLTFVDYFFSGASMIYLKRCLLVFTDRRIFHIPTKYNLKYRDSIAQFYYVDCNSIVLKIGKLIVTFKSSKSEKFMAIAMKDRKKINTILNEINFESGTARYSERVHLCPSCGYILEKDNIRCAGCQLEFKSKAEGKKLSIIFPGGGYFYTRHPILGIGDAISEVILLVIVIIAIFSTLAGEEEGLFLLIFFGILLGIEKAVTIYHSNHFIAEFIPKEQTFTRKAG